MASFYWPQYQRHTSEDHGIPLFSLFSWMTEYHRALNAGTGTGTWAIFVPPNVKFEVDDVCAEWTFAPNFFNYIHVRAMYGSVADWPAFYQEALTHLKPGGWFEQLEISIQFEFDDGTVKEGVENGEVLDKWSKMFINAGDKFGKTLQTAEKIEA
ncbi:MAG: hypothetical protein M1834_000289 [Cirrosporium novae-zelandiae]|nr:MAG: hypothetical protein M1834_000289 [Cirrosporium novae-zelandiae]